MKIQVRKVEQTRLTMTCIDPACEGLIVDS